jgi:hypothetical protein
MPTFTFAGTSFELDRDDIEAAAADVPANRVKTHFVVVNGHRYPPRQVVSRATGLRCAEFTSEHARTVLRTLGFEVGRATAPRELAAPLSASAYSPRQLAALERHEGKWVALAAPSEVLVAGDTPQEVLGWLARNGRRAQHGIVRVPAAPA